MSRLPAQVVLGALLGLAVGHASAIEGTSDPVAGKDAAQEKAGARPSDAADNGSAGFGNGQAKRVLPVGTFERPKDSPQVPEVDEAWANYDAAVEKATATLQDAIEGRWAAARKAGDLEAATNYRRVLESLQKRGKLPDDDKALSKTASVARNAYRRAATDLEKTYRAAVRRIIKDASLDQAIAERVEKERKQLVAAAGLTGDRPEQPSSPQSVEPQPKEAQAHVVGRWRDTREGFTWCFHPNGIVVIEQLAEGNNHKRGRWVATPDGEIRTLRGGQVDSFSLTDPKSMSRESTDAVFRRLE